MEATKCENIAATKAALSLLLPGFTRAVRCCTFASLHFITRVACAVGQNSCERFSLC